MPPPDTLEIRGRAMKVDFVFLEGAPEVSVNRQTSPMLVQVDYRLTLLEMHESVKMLLTQEEYGKYRELFSPKMNIDCTQCACHQVAN